MADVTTTMTVIDATLKDNQTARATTAQYDRSSQLPSKVSIGTGFWAEDQSGRRYIQPLATEPMNAYTRNVSDSRADSSTLEHQKAIYDPRSYIEAAIHIDFDANVRSDGTGPSQAFVKGLASQVTGVAEAIGSEQVRQTLTANGEGTLCAAAVTTSATNGNIVTLTDTDWEKVVKRDYITVGLKLDVWTASAGVPTDVAPVAEARKVTAITKSASANASTITLDGAAIATSSAGNIAIGIAGNRVWTGTATEVREITSLPTICDNTTSTTVGGLTGSTSHRWTGNVYDNSGGTSTNTAFSLANYMAALELSESRVGSEHISKLYAFCDRTRFNHALSVLAASQITYAGTSQVEGKFREEIPLQGGTTLVPERQAPPNKIYLVPTNHLEYIQPHGKKPVNWVEQSPNSYVKWDDNHGFVGMAFWNGDLATDQRAAFTEITYVL